MKRNVLFSALVVVLTLFLVSGSGCTTKMIEEPQPEQIPAEPEEVVVPEELPVAPPLEEVVSPEEPVAPPLEEVVLPVQP